MRIYIAGKITGEPIDECYEKFDREETKLMSRKPQPDVVNPLKLPGIHFGIKHNEAMSICFRALKECDAIYMLLDWEDSKGAKLELSQARDWGMMIIYQKNKQ